MFKIDSTLQPYPYPPSPSATGEEKQVAAHNPQTMDEAEQIHWAFSVP
jgi:hypothetical protein